MNVLFVDDEPKVLRAIERSLLDIKDNWTLHFSESAAEAWSILDSNAIDVVVSDMRMPDVDGAEFLAAVKQRTPDVARLVLSGYKDDDASIRSSSSAHRFLAKPISGEALAREIITAGLTRSDEFLRNVVNSITSLPSPLRNRQSLFRLLQDPSVAIDEVVALVRVDPALAVKVLQLGNSAFFGQYAVIPDLASCLEKIGPEALRHLLTTSGFMNTDTVPGGHNDELVARIQQHAVTSAAHVDPADGEIAYLGALLHVTGSLLYAAYGVDVAKQDENSACGHAAHNDIAVALLTLWGIPESIIAATRVFRCK
jgi:CheY-like chemotaxis protein